jgi:hypothetical protein
MYPSILTVTGRYFDFTAPEAHPYNIAEIAHALSNLCRYTGHTRYFYSVAQHSVLVSMLTPPEFALAGLLHDAAEAFLGDVSAPLKQLLPEYRALESKVEAAVLGHFGLSFPMPACIKHADLVALMTEERVLMPKHDDVWLDGKYEPEQGFSQYLKPLTPGRAYAAFLTRYYELTKKATVPLSAAA